LAVYSYTAINLDERPVTGTLAADTPSEGRQELRRRRLKIVAFQPARVRRTLVSLRPGGGRRRQDRVAEAARYLSLLLRAGVPLTESLDVLTRQQDDRFTTVLMDVRDRVTGGESLADALSVHNEWFDLLFVSAVRVGQLSGNLDEALTQLAEHLRARQTLQSTLAGALTYPLILLCLGTGVVIFLMTFVIPQLLTVLAASGRSLPASTRLLKGASDLLVGHWLIMALMVCVSIAAGLAVYRTSSGMRTLHLIQIRLPILGPLIKKTVVAQFCQQMSILLRTGIPFVEAAESVARLTRNVLLAEELSAMAQAVESGSDIAESIEDSRIFPPVVTHLMAVGQDSGELTEMFGELRLRYDTEVRLAIDKFTAALEPLLIVVLASAVGFVVFACLMPILEATRAVA